MDLEIPVHGGKYVVVVRQPPEGVSVLRNGYEVNSNGTVKHCLKLALQELALRLSKMKEQDV